MIVGAAALAFNLAVYGAHAVVPFRLAAADVEVGRRRFWALAAPLLLGASFLLTAARIAQRPDEAIAWGLTHPLTGAMPARLIAVALAALLAADLVTALGWRRLEPAGWRVVGVLGVVASALHALGSELLRAGEGPSSLDAGVLLAIAALRLPMALAAGELVAGAPRWAVPLAGPALLAATRLWPVELRLALGSDVVTLWIAAGLLVAARFVPLSLRRAAGAAGLALAVLFLARAAEVSRVLGVTERLPAMLVAP
jgi:hypothetical protein